MDMRLDVRSKSAHDSDLEEDSTMEDETMSVSSDDHITPKQFWRLGSADTDKTATTELTRDPIIRRPFWVYDFSSTSLHKVAEPIVHNGKIVKSCLKVKTNEESVRKQFFGGSMFVSNFHSSRSSIRKKTEVRKVSFSEVMIREYEVIVSDNPSVSSGPGIGLGWCYDQKLRKFELEDYEEAHPPRRKTCEIQIPKDLREQMLLEIWDVLPEEIEELEHESSYRNVGGG
eukprot:CAMPEP_0195295386 /NCGR_PEP_ID=MMETSP0707-20130614/17289_1 /TAXON_ID=33640 /ORGANISM="Asterionellopsis glacialis, Strain CCMP134" /LENGTH=228 /DNA_ID=CAMNT_0040356609 /DNA_START=197 /DNA_END=884 /DNA_ORIENTATION=-